MKTGLVKISRAIFPLKRHELPNFFVLSYCIFSITFIYNFLRPLKITLATSMSGAGAEVIPFLKIWGIIPASVFTTYVFTVLSRRVNFLNIIYIFLTLFLGYFFVFGVLLFPSTELLKLSGVAELLSGLLPSGLSGLRGLFACIEYWHISIFYVLCEIWVTSILYILFWGFVNERVHFNLAGRLYPLLNLSGNFGSVVAGILGMWVAKSSSYWGQSSGVLADVWMTGFSSVLCLVVGVFLIPIFRSAFHSMPVVEVSSAQEKKKAKSSLDDRISIPFFESLKIVCTERYILFLLVLVLAYNFVFNLSDVVWSEKVKQYYAGDRLAMAGFMSLMTLIKGCLSVVLALATHPLVKHLGWRTAALVTPVLILITSLVFFPVVLILQPEAGLFSWFEFVGSEQLLLWAIWVGGLQNSLARSTKYSIYDSVREMVYVPLSHGMRRRAKAILDGIGGRMGKALGAVVFLILQVIFGSLEASLPAISVITLLATIFWVYAIVQLDQMMRAKLEQQGRE